MAVMLLLTSVLILTVTNAQTDTISLLKKYPNSFISRAGSKLQIEGNNINTTFKIVK